MSYFHDDENGAVDSGAGESEGEDRQLTPTPEVSDTPGHATVSPRAISNSRRKRKRKTSQSEKKHARSSKSPPPTSPVEEKSVSLRANPSPAYPASPDSITSPCSPINALSSEWPPRRSVSSPLDISSRSNNTQPTSPTPWVSIEKRRKNSSTCDSSGNKTPKGSDGNDEESVLRSRAHSVPMACHQGDRQMHPDPVTTPVSVPRKALTRGKAKSETRTRLMNKFNALTGESETREPGKITYTRQKSTPVNEGPRGPWGCSING